MKRLFGLLGVVTCILLLGGSEALSQAAAPPAMPAAPATPDPANFTGQVTARPTADIRIFRYTFAPGGRTNWHSHENGQVIVVEEGRMRMQEQGGPVKEYGPGETVRTPPGVPHWHGAVPAESMTQVAFAFGKTTWMQKVTDAEYSAGARSDRK